MCRRAGCCAANDPDYCCLPPRHSRCMLGDQFPSRAAICHPCPSVNPLPSRTCVSHRRAIEGLLSSNDRRLTPPSFSSATLLSCSWTFSHTSKHHTAYPRAPTFQTSAHTHTHLRSSPSVIGRRSSIERSHLQPRWKRTLTVAYSSSPSVTV